jgi:hypothetical protein
MAEFRSGCFGLSCIAFGVFAAEALHAACGIHKLLLARKKGVAGGADFYADVCPCEWSE